MWSVMVSDTKNAGLDGLTKYGQRGSVMPFDWRPVNTPGLTKDRQGGSVVSEGCLSVWPDRCWLHQPRGRPAVKALRTLGRWYLQSLLVTAALTCWVVSVWAFWQALFQSDWCTALAAVFVGHLGGFVFGVPAWYLWKVK